MRGGRNPAPFFVSPQDDIIPKEEAMRTKTKREPLIDRVATFLTHVFNGFGIVGLTYIVCNDITAQEIISWLTK